MDHFIKSIKITGLFGRYNYSLPSNNEDLGAINIIYGENGTGKTTILTLVYHLISPSNKQGHRTKISEIPFAELVVTLKNGTTLSAKKDEQLLAGPVQFTIVHADSSSVTSWKFTPGKKSSFNLDTLPENIDLERLPSEFKSEVEQAIEARDFFRAISTLEIDTIMLTSDRLLMGDSLENQPGPSEAAKNRDRLSELVLEHRILALDSALQNVSRWLQSKFFENSYINENNVDPYLDVVKKIQRTTYKTRSGLSKPQEEKIISSLTSKIEELEKKLTYLQSIGYRSLERPSELIPIIKSVAGNKLYLIDNILQPYIEDLNLKLNNLMPVHSLAKSFIKIANGFFVDKEISYSLLTGITIHPKDSAGSKSKSIKPKHLSSGEQQLLLLLCYVLLAQDKPTIFIIDEPEISLNILWQRKLVSYLAKLGEKNIQFIFASHSMEILAKHRDRVIEIAAGK